MTLLDERPQRHGGVAPGGSASWLDLAGAAVNSMWYANNTNAAGVAIEEAYDQRIDAVFNRTGVRLPHPMRQPWEDARARAKRTIENIEDAEAIDPDRRFRDFDRRLQDLAHQFPEAMDAIKPGRSPREDARQRARDVERELQEIGARYRGFWATGTLAELGGSLVGGLRDPVNLMTMPLGPTGQAGAGLKGLLWMAIKNGAANAGAETLMQPAVASWRREAGLEYDASTFALNVGTAFAFGFGLDAGVRGAVRGVQRQRGMVPVLDEGGQIVDWDTPDGVMERAAHRSKLDLIRRAANQDTAALRDLARQSGVIRDPAVRSILDMLDDVEATSTAVRGVHPLDGHAAEVQAIRHLVDPGEPPPAPPMAGDGAITLYRGEGPTDPLRRQNRPGEWYTTSLERAQGYAGDSDNRRGVFAITVPEDQVGKLKRGIEDSEFMVPRNLHEGRVRLDDAELGARRAVADGLDAIETARLVREHPGAVAELPETEIARQGAAIARLSDQAFDLVMRGEAEPELGAMVARLVADPARQAQVLRQVGALGLDNPREIRRAIGTLANEEPARARIDEGIDDPAGPEALRQVEDLQAMLDEGDAAPAARGEIDQVIAKAIDAAPEASWRRALDEIDEIGRLRDVIEGCKL